MNTRVAIRASQSGWAVCMNGDLNNLHLFRSDEPERFVKFITEKVAGIKIDRIVEARLAEIEKARTKMDKEGSVYHS